VAPFALLAPCAGILSSALVFREVFRPMRYASMALILAGLAVIVLPTKRSRGPSGRVRSHETPVVPAAPAGRSVAFMSLAEARIRAFLDSREVVVLATVQADGAPLAMPMWFLHDATVLTMVSVADTQKVRNLRRDPRVSVVAEGGGTGAVRGVSVHGRAEFLSDGPERRALAERFVDKYRPYLERRWGGRAMPADRVMFRIVPSRVGSWGLD
jgi:PPOX class probable F420-dependent enzyme